MRRSVLAAAVAAATASLAFAPVPGSEPVAAAPATRAERWVRIQLDHRVRAADVAMLTEAGVDERQYVPDDAFVAALDEPTAAVVDALAGVTVTPVAAGDKVAAPLLGATGTVRVDILTSTAGASAVARDLDVLAAGQPLHAGSGTSVVRADVAASRLAALAASPDVLRISPGATGFDAEDEASAQTMAGNLDGRDPVVGYRDFLAGLGLDGSGVTVAITDDGIDPTHPDLSGRIVTRYSYGGEDAVVPAEGHGTHVAGIVGGLGADIGPAGPLTDEDGFAYGLGVAPGVSYVDQPVIQLGTSSLAFPNDGFRGLVGDALAAGATLWNASWTDGGGAGAGYVANAASLDGLTRDADAASEGDQPFTFVFSAGNSGSGPSTLTSPKEAKNIITVGSTVSHRAGRTDLVSGFSSRGPAMDGRIAPTIVAPGETIISARAATGALCTVPLSGTNDLMPVDGATLYTGCSGTSMASPHVAGAVALIQQWWRTAAGVDPSPALSRAVLVNNARDLRKGDVPNGDEGWGMVDLGAMFDPAVERVIEDQTSVLTDADQVATTTVEVADAGVPLRVTVAWTDAPGLPGQDPAPALVNDLDLVVVAPDGTTYLGNVFDGGASVPGGGPDRLNNLENVWLPAPQAGTYTIEVVAHRIPADGVPGLAGATDQDFALVVRNAVPAGAA